MGTLSGYNRDEILKDVHENVIEVTFTKNSGDRRRMICTLMPRYLPPMPPDGGRVLEEKHREYPNLVTVWDVENKGWRSFHVDSIVPGSIQSMPSYS